MDDGAQGHRLVVGEFEPPCEPEQGSGEVVAARNWAVPGGAIDIGESMSQAAVRETLEETGIDCEITGVVGIYTDPKHIILYTSNAEARQEFSILLTGRARATVALPIPR
jgi:ADP-ribose pyrophosphatase YjhB (NUDIX family)